MKKLMMTAAMGVALAACGQPNTLVCDREAIAWDKWGEPSEMAENCLPSAPAPYVAVVFNELDTDDQSPRVVPRVPSTPTSPPSTPPSGPTPPSNSPSTPDKPNTPDNDTPRGGPKGNNGHGNGDQAAPGRSGGRNNAENSDNSGQGNSGRGRGGLKGTPNNN